MTDNVIRIPRHGMKGYYALADLPQQEPIEKSAYSAGWPVFDEFLKLYPGQFLMVTGLPGHGKSTLMLNVVLNIAKQHGTRTFMFVPENERHILDKLKRIHGGLQQEFDVFAKEYLFIQSAEYENWWEDQQTVHWLLERAWKAYNEDGIGFVLADPWNELERAKQRDESMTDYIGSCLMMMKRFVRMADVTYCMIAHPTKDVCKDRRRPTLADIEGSQNWYNKCDNGLIVERDFTCSITTVVSAKVRERGAGKIGECKFSVDPRSERFETCDFGGGYAGYDQR